MVTFLSTSGTSPWATRMAKPSTTAVFPTPASPTIVLPAAGENIHHLPDFEIPSEDRVKIPLESPFREIVRVLIELRGFGGPSGCSRGIRFGPNSSSSEDLEMMAPNSSFRVSAEMFSNSRLIPVASRLRSPSDTRARTVCPVRIWFDRCSRERMSQAFEGVPPTSDSEPVFSRFRSSESPGFP